MNATRVSLNPNSRYIFTSAHAMEVKKGLSDFRREVMVDKKLEPSRIFKSNEADGNALIWRGLRGTVEKIEPNKKRAAQVYSELKAFMLDFHRKNPNAPQEEFEDGCRFLITQMIPNYETKLERALSNRSGIIFREIKPYLSGKTLLDVGAGNCKVAALVKEKAGMGVTPIDVINYNATDLPLSLFNGEKIPFGQKIFDTVLVAMVLHHAENPLKLLQEAKRVANSRIIIIESVYFNKEHKAFAAFTDWMYNRVLNHGVNCPFNFQTPKGWESTFRQFGMKIAAKVDLGVDMKLVPEYHVLYALDFKN